MEIEERPLVLRLMERGSDQGQQTMATGEVVIRPRRKLRLLRAFEIKFIRGPRDRSLWREEGRLEAHQQRDFLQSGNSDLAHFRRFPRAEKEAHQVRWNWR
ncbi:hypothetical protein SAMN05444487_10496 [Marininema mesophilum]|uniref:Uncharacterized protein n=1 Tax=Marininema mesophilum TaxID=1048340 RepID=A0A1H2UI22_9BACL|nr:hypothetical protein [Marininema mesophilum]SDW55164.1 hypothetical protein SAMN05444487_10496 [Marininema mesophilum]